MVSMHYLVGSDCSLVQCFISQALTPFQPHLQVTYLPSHQIYGPLNQTSDVCSMQRQQIQHKPMTPVRASITSCKWCNPFEMSILSCQGPLKAQTCSQAH